MAKEILIYNPIYDFTAADFINQMEANKGEDVSIRLNCPGGGVYAAYGMYAKYAEHSKGKKVKVDGQAKSGGFFFCVYADDVECLDVSDFMIHRAAMPSWIENDPKEFTDEVKAVLTRMNDGLKAATAKKIDPAMFKELKGVSLDDVFSLDKRIDVNITAAEAKQMGLVQTITPLTPAKKKEINTYAARVGAMAIYTETEISIPQNQNKMTASEFKAANPAEYATIVAEGVTAEKTRVDTLMVYVDVDPVAVATAIKEGKTLDPVMAAEFGRKLVAKAGITAISADGAAVPVITTTTPGAQATAEQVAEAKFLAEVAENRKKMTI